MKYVRLFTGSDGESHFEDVDVAGEEVVTSTGVRTIKGRSAPVDGHLTFTTVCEDSDDDAADGGWGPWHPNPGRFFMSWFVGVTEIQASDGEIRRFGPEDLLLVEDTVGRGHRNRRLTRELRTVFIPVAD